MRNKFLPCSLIILLLSVWAVAQTTTRLKFAKGRSSATVSGTIRKDKTKCFILQAKSGQEIVAKLWSKNGKVQFPFTFGADEFNGGTDFNATTKSGDNEVCVEHYLVKKATTFTLTISIR